MNKLTESKLDKIIRESVKYVINEGNDVFITINGKPYTKKEFMAYKKQQARDAAIKRGEDPDKPKKSPKKQQETMGDDQASPKGLAANVKKLVLDQRLVSVRGFITNGERQFGPNAVRTLVNMFKGAANGKDLFAIYNRIYTGITQTINEIETWGRKNESAVYERASKLANLLRDMSDILDEMSEAYIRLVDGKKIERVFGSNANVIMGNGHSLGLKSLIFAKGSVPLAKVTGNLLFNASKLDDISNNGRDPFDYDPNVGRRR